MNTIQEKVKKAGMLLFLAMILGMLAGPTFGQIAVVVNPESKVEDISSEQLSRMYLGSATTLESGQTVYLMENGALAKQFYAVTVDLTVAKFRKHWMKLVFSGAYAQPPDPFQGNDEILETVARTRGAICFLEFDDVTSDVRVVSIDGLKPGEKGYLFSPPTPDENATGKE